MPKVKSSHRMTYCPFCSEACSKRQELRIHLHDNYGWPVDRPCPGGQTRDEPITQSPELMRTEPQPTVRAVFTETVSVRKEPIPTVTHDDDEEELKVPHDEPLLLTPEFEGTSKSTQTDPSPAGDSPTVDTDAIEVKCRRVINTFEYNERGDLQRKTKEEGSWVDRQMIQK